MCNTYLKSSQNPVFYSKWPNPTKMVDINVTVLESHDEENEMKIKPKEDGKPPNQNIKVKTHPCDKCDNVFPKIGPKSLHIGNAHNIKTIQYTPAPGTWKDGRLAFKFTSDLCTEKKKTESKLRNHITYKHDRAKRGMSELWQGPLQRTSSVKLSPPNKKPKEGLKEKDANKDLNPKKLEITSRRKQSNQSPG